MQSYEIRTLDSSMKPTFSINGEYENDEAAIADARKRANGNAFEVWRDSIRIYRVPPDTRRAGQAA